MELQTHWQTVYQTKSPTQVSWYQEHSLLSLQFIQRTGAAKTGQIIDVGGGASTLVDDLLTEGFKNLTVLDISASSLQTAQQRLGLLTAQVAWVEADVTQATLPHHFYDVWHDRAVFHFLTRPEDRERYVRLVKWAVKPGGHVIVATFALDGPAQCSGLDVMRYDSHSLHAEFGNNFDLVDKERETHLTPFGKEQKFIYCYCRKEN